MNERIGKLAEQAGIAVWGDAVYMYYPKDTLNSTVMEKFAQLIVAECVNREALLGAIARGWCSEKNSHKIMDSDLALAIFDQVDQQIRQQFGVEK